MVYANSPTRVKVYKGLMMVSQRACKMRINVKNFIDVLPDYTSLVYGAQYVYRYADIPMQMAQGSDIEISFYRLLCGMVHFPSDHMRRAQVTPCMQICGAHYILGNNRQKLDAFIRTRANRKAAAVIE